MKRKVISVTFIFVLLILCSKAYAQDVNVNLNLSTDAYILMDANTGDVLVEKNADKPLYPASITKTMTAILAIEHGDFDKPYTASRNAVTRVGIGGSIVGLKAQEEVYLSDLLYMMMLPSGNDAANVIAENTAGSIENFVRMMNEKARQLGAVNTYFSNPIGLDKGDGHPNHKTTARDFALITRYAMSLEKYRQVVGTAQFQLPKTNKHTNWGITRSTNRFYSSISYDKSLYVVNGGKTGKTGSAANTLVISAANGDNAELICVLLKNWDRVDIFYEAKKLMDYGFGLIRSRQLSLSSGFYDVRYRESRNIVDSFTKLGYISGFEDNSFRPLSAACREDFINCFMKVYREAAAGRPELQTKHCMEIALERGFISTSWQQDKSRPVTRDEAISILCKSFEEFLNMECLDVAPYADIVRGYVRDYVLDFYNNRMLQPEKLKKMNESITREEMVVLLAKYRDLQYQKRSVNKSD